MLRVAAITIGPAGPDLSPMLAQAEDAIIRAAGEGAKLVVLPELFALPYFASDAPARWLHAGELLTGTTGGWAGELARRVGIYLIFGMAVADGGNKPVNAAVLAAPNGELRIIAGKQRLPPALPDDAFGEADHFQAGKIAPSIVTVGDIRIAAIVCYDRRFPDAWCQAGAAGADLVAVLVAGPAPDDPPGAYEAELCRNARANAAFVATAARCGTETLLGRPVRHDGASLMIDCDGNISAIAEQKPGAMALLQISVQDLARARAIRARYAAPDRVEIRLPERKIQ